jgi:membrane protein
MRRLAKPLRNITQWWRQQDPATRLFFLYVRQAITNFTRYGSRRAAALAYYAIFSIFPLTLLLAIGISRIVGTTIAQEQIGNALALFLPESSETVTLFQDSIQRAMDQNTSFGIIALAGLIWAGSGLFTNVASSLDLIFHVPQARSLWRQRLVALLMIMTLIVLVTASFITSGIIGLLSIFFLNRPGLWLTVASVFLPLSLNMMMFVLLFRFVPLRTVHWDAIWPAAILGAVGFELAKRAFAFYLANFANYQVVYGSITAVIILLFWTYLLASIFLFSAELCAQLNEWFVLRDQEGGFPALEASSPPQLPD